MSQIQRITLSIALLCGVPSGISSASGQEIAPKPLFEDPNYHGSCDPEIIWNPATSEWLIYYTARRATRAEGGVAAADPIGVAGSKDWLKWTFKGYCRFDGKDDQPDASHTYWAPGIVRDGDTLHMFVTFKSGTNGWWGSGAEGIRHYTAHAGQPMDWRLVGRVIQSTNAIDAGLVLKGDEWLMYYRDADTSLPRGTTTFWAASKDLKSWTLQGPAGGDVNDRKVTGFNYQEAQHPFFWRDSYWLLTDPSGPPIAVYRSEDAIHWGYTGNVLDVPGKDRTDKSFGRHPSVAIVGKRAFVVYHVEPDRDYDKPYPQQAPEKRRCYLQMAELHVEDGRLVCDRDRPVVLPPRGMKGSTNGQ